MTVIDHQRKAPAVVSGGLRALVAAFDPGEPHQVRGPFARWPHGTDGALVLVVFCSSLIAVAVSALDDGEDFTAAAVADRPTGAVLLLALAAVSLWWRRSHPIAVTAVVLAVLIVWALADYGDGQDLALAVAVYSVGRYTVNHRRSLAAVTAAIAIALAGTVVDGNQRIDIAPAVILTVLPWYIGRRIRNRGDYLTLLQDRNERLQAEQLARARQAVSDERTRIARELHDVVAHQVSMMTVQAGAARTIAARDLGAAVEAMGDVERAGRQALGELRHLLGVLRAEALDDDHLGPQPGLGDVPALVDHLAHTGAEVSCDLAGVPEHLSAALDLSAYRIIQESITNVIRHAGPEPAVHITVAVVGDRLEIDVTNTTDGSSARLPASGFGIAGMRERVAVLGGTLTAGPQSPGHHRVHASLPLEPGPG